MVERLRLFFVILLGETVLWHACGWRTSAAAVTSPPPAPPVRVMLRMESGRADRPLLVRGDARAVDGAAVPHGAQGGAEGLAGADGPSRRPADLPVRAAPPGRAPAHPRTRNTPPSATGPQARGWGRGHEPASPRCPRCDQPRRQRAVPPDLRPLTQHAPRPLVRPDGPRSSRDNFTARGCTQALFRNPCTCVAQIPVFAA